MTIGFITARAAPVAWMVALMAGMTPTAAHAGESQKKVTVYLRDRASVLPRILIPAEVLAGRMFARIGISLDWGKGEPAGESSQPFVVIELATGMPARLRPGALAYALPFEGTHITVFFDRIEKIQDPHTVLAHVMVHEITHLLQGVNRHSDAGVMKAHWTGSDFQGMRRGPLPFTGDDVNLIYRGLARPARTAAPVAAR